MGQALPRPQRKRWGGGESPGRRRETRLAFPPFEACRGWALRRLGSACAGVCQVEVPAPGRTAPPLLRVMGVGVSREPRLFPGYSGTLALALLMSKPKPNPHRGRHTHAEIDTPTPAQKINGKAGEQAQAW